MTYLNRLRSGSSLLSSFNSTYELSKVHNGTFDLEAAVSARNFLSDTDTYSLYKLEFRYLPKHSSIASVHGWGRITVSFSSAGHSAISTPDQSGGSSGSSNYKSQFTFPLKYHSPAFPISYDKLLYRQYFIRSSSKTPRLPTISYSIETSNYQVSPVGSFVVDWVIKKYRDSTVPTGDPGEDAIDT